MWEVNVCVKSECVCLKCECMWKTERMCKKRNCRKWKHVKCETKCRKWMCVGAECVCIESVCMCGCWMRMFVSVECKICLYKVKVYV